ncbi:hypothetical protein ACFSKL_00500 [Belliella marina]|uniref:PKD domain-containing protein n=1 Tax=Belliella marina TaxID=1644146 RepID=A0ABW4VID0_9BACT
MKHFKYILAMLLPLCLVISCIVDDNYELGVLLDPSEIQFRVVQDFEADPGGNTVILINDTPETIPVWNFGTGKSNRQVDTVRYAFKGSYEIHLSIVSGGGLVQVEPVTIEVTEDNLNYVDDPLWTAISGGVGEEKTWVLDIDAKFFNGPLFFFGTDNGYLAEGGQWSGGETGCYGDDCWSWEPDYVGNEWLMEHGDYGTMTFNLKGGPFVKVEHLKIPQRGSESGTYFIDIDNKTLTMTNATPLHDIGRDPVVSQWGNIRLISLTEDSMQLGVIRDSDPNDGTAMLVYNYISKEYSDNWVPGDEPDPEPPYQGDANADLTTSVTTSKRWEMSQITPYNWTDLAGDFLNDWNGPQDYIGSGWAPFDLDMLKNISLTLSKTGSNSGDYSFTNGSGEVISGSYSVDDENNIIFDRFISFGLSGWLNFATTSENGLRLIRTETDALGNITGIWLGQKDPAKPEYLAYHFVP